jgi:SRSO17 transposase
VCGGNGGLGKAQGGTGEQAFYRCWSPEPRSLHDLVTLAGARWAIEESFQQAKGRVGLDQHQICTWDATHRHLTLAMAAYLVIALTTIAARTDLPEDDGSTGSPCPRPRS